MNPWDVGRILRLYHMLTVVLDADEAEAWLVCEQSLFDGQRPCAMIATPNGFYQVEKAISGLIAAHGYEE